MPDLDLRPRGSVERTCELCQWSMWFDPLSSEATAIPFICPMCTHDGDVNVRCAACNIRFVSKHRSLIGIPDDAYRCSSCVEIAPGERAAVVHCYWCDSPFGAHAIGVPDCHGAATREVSWPNYPGDPPGSDPRVFLACDACHGDWLYDKGAEEQKAILRRRGAAIIELPGGAWEFKYPQHDFSLRLPSSKLNGD